MASLWTKVSGTFGSHYTFGDKITHKLPTVPTGDFHLDCVLSYKLPEWSKDDVQLNAKLLHTACSELSNQLLVIDKNSMNREIAYTSSLWIEEVFAKWIKALPTKNILVHQTSNIGSAPIRMDGRIGPRTILHIGVPRRVVVKRTKDVVYAHLLMNEE